MYKRESNISTIISIVFVLFLSAVCFLSSSTYFSSRTTVVATINKMENVVGGDSSKYLVFSTLENGTKEVFQNEDNIVYGKFNSSDVYAELEIGNTYEFTVIGWRIPFFSEYRNILEYKLVQ